MKRSDNFVCAHVALKYCKRTYEECNKGCREYGNCGECENYHIPYSQEPCNNCEYLKVGANINREGGKDGNR